MLVKTLWRAMVVNFFSPPVPTIIIRFIKFFVVIIVVIVDDLMDLPRD